MPLLATHVGAALAINTAAQFTLVGTRGMGRLVTWSSARCLLQRNTGTSDLSGVWTRGRWCLRMRSHCLTACATVGFMAIRDKRSVSLPPELAQAIDEEAAALGTTFSAWLAQTAARQLKLEAGRRGLAEWEAENGPLTQEELSQGLAEVRELLHRSEQLTILQNQQRTA